MVESKYEQLRAWYLARLRKQSLEAGQAQMLTPTALIAADRENVEKLIIAKASSDSENPTVSALEQKVWIEVLVGFCFSIYLLFVFTGFDFDQVVAILRQLVDPQSISSNQLLPAIYVFSLIVLLALPPLVPVVAKIGESLD